MLTSPRADVGPLKRLRVPYAPRLDRAVLVTASGAWSPFGVPVASAVAASPG
ncbi:hypothetical protein ACFQ08_06300 [Streptosporangium algeriense]|uniref:Uncharacterized protein n=1 Tax=Streptosporangium algeriense TaxID=1682748 RepID=A0ABW3DLS1_9ACTN